MIDENKRKNVEKFISRKSITNIFNARVVFQSLWIRCRPIFSNITDRKFMDSELRLVLYCGGVFWFLYLLSQII